MAFLLQQPGSGSRGWRDFLVILLSLEPTHLKGASREGAVHIIADDEVAIHHCVLLLCRLLLLGQRRLESDVSLEERPTGLMLGSSEVMLTSLTPHLRIDQDENSTLCQTPGNFLSGWAVRWAASVQTMGVSKEPLLRSHTSRAWAQDVCDSAFNLPPGPGTLRSVSSPRSPQPQVQTSARPSPLGLALLICHMSVRTQTSQKLAS